MGWYRNTYFPISVADSLLRSEATWGTIRIHAAHSESEVAPGPRGLEPRGHGGAARLRLQNGYCERRDGEVADARAALRARPRRAWHSGKLTPPGKRKKIGKYLEKFGVFFFGRPRKTPGSMRRAARELSRHTKKNHPETDFFS